MRQNLAFNLKAIIAQKLLPTTKELGAPTGQTRVPTIEIMRINPIVRKLILNEEDIKLGEAIRMGKEEGMMDFTESLRQLVVAEKIERATAFEVAPSPETLKMAPQGDYHRPTGHPVRVEAPPGSSPSRRAPAARRAAFAGGSSSRSARSLRADGPAGPNAMADRREVDATARLSCSPPVRRARSDAPKKVS